jgi:hypothetical protein
LSAVPAPILASHLANDAELRQIGNDASASTASQSSNLQRVRASTYGQAGRAEKKMPALLIFTGDGTSEMGWLSRFEQLFPRHRSVVIRGSHHFPQVYDSLGVATAIRNWWDEEIAS